MLDHAYAVIMAGGRGERFWPLSTSTCPKQLLAIVGDETMIAMTVRYLHGLIPPERTFIVTSEALADATRDAVPLFPPENVIGEPVGRDTAAACALGCALVRARDPEGVFCVLTADHVIKDITTFQKTLQEGLALAAAEPVLVTLGISPTFPSTGFGYIEAGERIEGGGDIEFYRALRFVEKPDAPTAEEYVAAGNYFWNSGMFLWSAETFGQSLAANAPELAEMANHLAAASDNEDFRELLGDIYPKLTKISVDYAIMEKATNIIMARGAFDWDDVGSWPALANHFDPDADGNIVVGEAETLDASGNVIFSKERFTALIGVKDLVVVQAPGATLICPKDRAQEVKELVKRLSESGQQDDLL